MKYYLRFDNKKQAVVTLLKSFAGSAGEYCLIDTWNGCLYQKGKQDGLIHWTENVKSWFLTDDVDEIIKNAKKIVNLNPEHSWFIETETGVKSSNSPANEGWIVYNALADWMIDNPDELAEFTNYEEREE